MSGFRLIAPLAFLTGLLLRAADWPMPSGGPQRNGWARSEHIITKANARGLKLLYKYRAENVARGLHALTPPIIDGNLITYRGFKEMLMFGASGDKVYSVDADLNQVIWESHLDYRGDKPPAQASTSACPGGLTAPIVMAGSSSATMHFTAEASRTPAAAGTSGIKPRRRPSPYFPPLSQSIYPMKPDTLTQLAALYAVSSDGSLHVLNSSTGGDLISPIKFLPPNANVTSLNIWENMIYATTTDHCDGFLNALYAIDLLTNEKKVAVFGLETGGFAGMDGTTIGNNGTVYVQVRHVPGQPAGEDRETILALTPRDLQVRDYFTPEDKHGRKKEAAPGITPMVFPWMGRDVILAGGSNGRLYLLDSRSLGGTGHRTPLFESEPLARADKDHNGSGFRGAFSSWRDVDTQTRWIYAPVSGPPAAAAKLTDGDSVPANGSILALRLAEGSQQPQLQPLWVSRDMLSPAPVVIANGMVLALSTGEPARLAAKNGKPYSVAEWEALASHGTLYVLDAITGKELFSSGDAVSTYAHPGGLAVANGRVYFTAHDNTVYCFGFPREQLQLTEQ